MKLNALTLSLLSALALPALASPASTANLTVATTTNSRDFPLQADEPLVIPLTKGDYTLTISGIGGDCPRRSPNKRSNSTRPSLSIAMSRLSYL